MREKLTQILQTTLQVCLQQGFFSLEKNPEMIIETPSSKGHGDFASNLALVLASLLKKKPRAIAEQLKTHLQDPDHLIAGLEIAGPGFLNFTLSPIAYQKSLREILGHPKEFGHLEIGKGQKILIEYVSANPTGPMHIGHGRNAVVGDTLARLLGACGYEVHKEFYINDHGVQIQTLGRSVLYYLEKSFPSLVAGEGENIKPPPEGSYQGAYLEELVRRHEKELRAAGPDPLKVGKIAGLELLEKLKGDLADLRVYFDEYFPESSLYESDAIRHTLAQIKGAGHLFEEEGATWFRSTVFGDDKDRVLIKQDGSYTYFTPDIAYHQKKFERRFDCYINVWGADHAGYIPRIKAAIAALGYDPQKLHVVLMQMVNLKRGGERVQMSKRAGTYVTLNEVVEEVGADAARFFFMLRSANAQLDFDLELAKKQSAENPVFYVQYAYARIASIFRKASEKGILFDEKQLPDLSSLELPEEFDLIRQISEYPDLLKQAAREFEPHRVGFYLLSLAKAFQAYYSRAKSDARYRVLTENQSQTLPKLALLYALRMTFERGLEILGVSAPQEMRLEEE